MNEQEKEDLTTDCIMSQSTKYLSIHLSIHLSIYLFIYLSIYVFPVVPVILTIPNFLSNTIQAQTIDNKTAYVMQVTIHLSLSPLSLSLSLSLFFSLYLPL